VSKLHLYLLALAIALAGIALCVYKAVVLQLPLWSGQRAELWRVESELRFRAQGGPAKVTVQLPSLTGRLQVIDQSFVSSGYGLTVAPGETNQQASFSIAAAEGEQVLYSRVVVFRTATQDTESREPVPEIIPPTLSAPQRLAAYGILADTRSRAADAETLAALIAQRLHAASSGDQAAFLLGLSPSAAKLVAVTVDLLALAAVPARSVHGVSIELERRNAEFVHWLEVYDKGRWRPVYLPETRPEAVRHYLPWWRGRAPFAAVRGRRSHHITVSLATSCRADRAQEAACDRRQLMEFSLFPAIADPVSVPLAARDPGGHLPAGGDAQRGEPEDLRHLHAVPRALAFRKQESAGVAFFCIIVAIGLSYVLSGAPGLLWCAARRRRDRGADSGVLTVLFHRLGFSRGLSLGLFPIVILTMTIERMSLVWEENGAREALQQAAGSLAVGTIAFLIMNIPQLEHLLFVFPEMLLVVLAATLLLGRYSGYRLTELWRFRALAQ
jgi:hypothetical protein